MNLGEQVLSSLVDRILVTKFSKEKKKKKKKKKKKNEILGTLCRQKKSFFLVDIVVNVLHLRHD